MAAAVLRSHRASASIYLVGFFIDELCGAIDAGIILIKNPIIFLDDTLWLSMLKLANQVIVLDRLNINGRLHRLSRELQITVGHDEDRLTLSNEEFGLLVLSPTLEEGIAGISDELSMLWEVYIAENPANLTRDALRLRSNLKSLVAAGAGS